VGSVADWADDGIAVEIIEAGSSPGGYRRHHHSSGRAVDEANRPERDNGGMRRPAGLSLSPSITTLRGTTKGGKTSCCSLAIQTPIARRLCDAGSDWVGSYAITIKRRRDRSLKVQSRAQTARCNLESEEVVASGSCFATLCPKSDGR
jgi:hypothetical protein